MSYQHEKTQTFQIAIDLTQEPTHQVGKGTGPVKGLDLSRNTWARVELTKQKSNNKSVYIYFCLPMHAWALMGAHQTALQNGSSSMEELLGP
jgi:hypothetical protein